MSWDRRYPPSRPRRVDGGIKARSARGSIGQSWWSRRFVDVIESFALGTRMTRGRSYARAGQVISLEVSPGVVGARVQGSRSHPYTVAIGLKPVPERTWRRVEKALAEQAIFSARLLAGELPPELEDVFAEAGVRLFPSSVRELTMRCSCPDIAVPCKHLAATFYLLAESFDTDPFQILHWRGRRQDHLLDRLRAARAGTRAAGQTRSGGASDAGGAGGEGPRQAEPEPVCVLGAGPALADVAVRPLAGCLGRFWDSPQALPSRPPMVDVDHDLLLRQLPAPDERIGGGGLTDQLRQAYGRFPMVAD
ncbi:MAG: hypothetical protein HKP61_13530 [Dactylosporangium sp.]|nr:SWIM zinc finger family protein [Dactylosporangium sp.]NNJ61935.1 hypothetical protein [Dactylosporangium sp.]